MYLKPFYNFCHFVKAITSYFNFSSNSWAHLKKCTIFSFPVNSSEQYFTSLIFNFRNFYDIFPTFLFSHVFDLYTVFCCITSFFVNRRQVPLENIAFSNLHKVSAGQPMVEGSTGFFSYGLNGHFRL